MDISKSNVNEVDALCNKYLDLKKKFLSNTRFSENDVQAFPSEPVRGTTACPDVHLGKQK